jgi:hypothetical protein
MKGFLLGCCIGLGVIVLASLMSIFVAYFPVLGLCTIMAGVVLFFGLLFGGSFD